MDALNTYVFPLIAILRGLTTCEVPAVAHVLFNTGFRLLEVPLNRPDALAAIRALVRLAPDDAVIGGGTVLTVAEIDAVFNAGGRLIVSPNCEPDIIAYAVKKGMMVLPGVATPSEAFRALTAGAHGLKLFPAEMITPLTVKSLRSVLPAKTSLFPVGSIQVHSMAPYIASGASGFGIGSQLYRPGIDPVVLQSAATAFMAEREAIMQRS